MTLRQAVAYLGDGEGNGPAFETLRYLVHRVRLIPKYRFGRGRGLTYVKKADLDALVARGFQPAAGPDFRVVRPARTPEIRAVHTRGPESDDGQPGVRARWRSEEGA